MGNHCNESAIKHKIGLLNLVAEFDNISKVYPHHAASAKQLWAQKIGQRNWLDRKNLKIETFSRSSSRYTHKN